MSIRLLVKKLYLDETKFIDSNLLKKYCKKLNLDYYTAIRYLISNKYLYRILRGIFYKPSLGERKFNKIEANYLEAISAALKIKGITNWYFGLETAIKLNKLTHEYFAVDYVISDNLFRHKPIKILGHKIKFVKLKEKLLSFGVHKKHKIRFSDNEKTILDIIYLSRYDGLSDNEIRNRISDLIKHCSKEKVLKYSKKYNRAINLFVRKI